MAYLIAIISLLGMGAIAPLLAKYLHGRAGWLIALLPTSIFAFLLTKLPAIQKGDIITSTLEWVPSLGVSLSFYLDGLSLMMALLVTGIGALVCVYAGGYLAHDKNLGRFFSFLLIFMAAMLGVVLSGNLIALFLFWELTSISSFLLIGFKHKKYESRMAAQQALFITGAGGLALLGGLVAMGLAAGTFEYTTLLNQPIIDHPLYTLVFILVLLAAITKSAQTPFHFWLPGAMAAPTPVSAYLHSATMVKAGIYLLARMLPVLGHTDLWFYTVTAFGAVTMTVGAFLSWQNSDLKKILAYSTISVLGTLVMLLGLGSKSYIAIEAFAVFLMAHAFYKGCLFMVAGSIDHETGTREIDQLSGLRKVMPITFIAALLAALSKAGIPFFLGFIGKELLYEATLETAGWLVVALTALAVLSNAMVGASAALVAVRPFIGELKAPKDHVHEAPVSMWLGPITLATLGVIIGIFPSLLDYLTSQITLNVYGELKDVHLAIWHGFKPPLYLSILTVTLAGVIYFVRDRLVQPLAPLRGDSWGVQVQYDRFIKGLLATAAGATKISQSGNLRYYLSIIVTFMSLLVGYVLFRNGLLTNIPTDLAPIRWYETIILVSIAIAALLTPMFSSRLAAVASLGVVGFGLAALFIYYGAPDLAMTQFAIETLTIVLIALIMGRLPLFLKESKQERTYSLFIAGFFGLIIFSLVYVTLAFPADSQLTSYFAENSYDLAKGRNVVNVILVDFRGLDTLGEITVLTIAGLGVYAFSSLQFSDEDLGDLDDDQGESE